MRSLTLLGLLSILGSALTISDSECIVSLWSSWSDCTGVCFRGRSVRTRKVFRPPLVSDLTEEIRPCPHLYETKTCTRRCTSTLALKHANIPVEEAEVCRVGEWGGWSNCDGNCGAGWVTRSRVVLHPPLPTDRFTPLPCPMLYEARICSPAKCERQPERRIIVTQAPTTRAPFDELPDDLKGIPLVYVPPASRSHSTPFSTADPSIDPSIDPLNPDMPDVPDPTLPTAPRTRPPTTPLIRTLNPDDIVMESPRTRRPNHRITARIPDHRTESNQFPDNRRNNADVRTIPPPDFSSRFTNRTDRTPEITQTDFEREAQTTPFRETTLFVTEERSTPSEAPETRFSATNSVVSTVVTPEDILTTSQFSDSTESSPSFTRTELQSINPRITTPSPDSGLIFNPRTTADSRSRNLPELLDLLTEKFVKKISGIRRRPTNSAVPKRRTEALDAVDREQLLNDFLNVLTEDDDYFDGIPNSEATPNLADALPHFSSCRVGPWQEWGPCRGSCPLSWQLRHRLVIQPTLLRSDMPSRGCPALYEVKLCSTATCPGNFTETLAKFLSAEVLQGLDSKEEALDSREKSREVVPPPEIDLTELWTAIGELRSVINKSKTEPPHEVTTTVSPRLSLEMERFMGELLALRKNISKLAADSEIRRREKEESNEPSEVQELVLELKRIINESRDFLVRQAEARIRALSSLDTTPQVAPTSETVTEAHTTAIDALVSTIAAQIRASSENILRSSRNESASVEQLSSSLEDGESQSVEESEQHSASLENGEVSGLASTEQPKNESTTTEATTISQADSREAVLDSASTVVVPRLSTINGDSLGSGNASFINEVREVDKILQKIGSNEEISESQISVHLLRVLELLDKISEDNEEFRRKNNQLVESLFARLSVRNATSARQNTTGNSQLSHTTAFLEDFWVTVAPNNTQGAAANDTADVSGVSSSTQQQSPTPSEASPTAASEETSFEETTETPQDITTEEPDANVTSSPTSPVNVYSPVTSQAETSAASSPVIHSSTPTPTTTAARTLLSDLNDVKFEAILLFDPILNKTIPSKLRLIPPQVFAFFDSVRRKPVRSRTDREQIREVLLSLRGEVKETRKEVLTVTGPPPVKEPPSVINENTVTTIGTSTSTTVMEATTPTQEATVSSTTLPRRTTTEEIEQPEIHISRDIGQQPINQDVDTMVMRKIPVPIRNPDSDIFEDLDELSRSHRLGTNADDGVRVLPPRFLQSRKSLTDKNPGTCRKVAMPVVCPDGARPQQVMRWYFWEARQQCSSYIYGYCGSAVELLERPIRSREECERTCSNFDPFQ